MPNETKRVYVDLAKTNWILLRLQKMALIELTEGQVVTKAQAESIEGILHFLDFVQDEVVDSGQVDEAVVFPSRSRKAFGR